MMAARFRINRYNWFGQKLLTQHEYSDVVLLRQYLANPAPQEADGKFENVQTSDWITYINGLALIKTSTHLDEVIYSLQQINYDKNVQLFLLLCQCLLYLGHHESVVAICRHVIDREIDSKDHGLSSADLGRENGDDLRLRQDSGEFDKIVSRINGNYMISEPRLWVVLGVCLEYQRRLKDAELALKVAAKLSLHDGARLDDNNAHVEDTTRSIVSGSSRTSQSPTMRFVEFRLRHANDYWTGIQSLSQLTSVHAENFPACTTLSLLISGQPSANQSHFNKALNCISSLEAHLTSHKNPSMGYNLLASKCRPYNHFSHLDDFNLEMGDDNRNDLNFLLTKCYIMMNNVVQSSSQSLVMYKSHLSEVDDHIKMAVNKQMDKLIESLRTYDPTCWASASFWSNLGACFLIKRKFVAALSCLIRAQQIEPLDWRINYNLGLTCLHVGQVSRALVNLLNCSRLYKIHQKSVSKQKQFHKYCPDFEPSIATLIAICYDKLEERNNARRHYVEAMRRRNCTPVASLVSYLVFAHRIYQDQPDDEMMKIKIHILDTLEQAWLQRNQNDSQYNRNLFLIASEIADSSPMGPESMRGRTFAWTKSD